MTKISRGDAQVSRRSKNRSPGGCLGNQFRRAIDRSPQMASPVDATSKLLLVALISPGGGGIFHRGEGDIWDTGSVGGTAT